jgi:alpha/beta hydrolase fold
MYVFIDQVILKWKGWPIHSLNQECMMSLNDRSIGSISFPSAFESREIETNGVIIHTRMCGQGPAVVMLHGFGTTGDMWIPLASVLATDHTVIVPDLRGLGLSSKPSGGYDKKTQSQDVAGVMDALGISSADFVTHDIGNMVGYAFAAKCPDRRKWMRRDRQPCHTPTRY